MSKLKEAFQRSLNDVREELNSEEKNPIGFICFIPSFGNDSFDDPQGLTQGLQTLSSISPRVAFMTGYSIGKKILNNKADLSDRAFVSGLLSNSKELDGKLIFDNMAMATVDLLDYDEDYFDGFPKQLESYKNWRKLREVLDLNNKQEDVFDIFKAMMKKL